MKIKIIFIGVAVFLYVLFGIPVTDAETKNIIISEVQITGGNGHTNDEFVELYNAGSDDQIINNWELRRKTKSDDSARGKDLFHKFEGGTTIPAGKYFLWTNKDSDANFIDLFDVQSKNKTSPNLTNDNSLGLYDDADVLIDAITWGSGHTSPFSPSILYSDNPLGDKSLVCDRSTPACSLSDTPTPTNSRGETYLPAAPIDTTGLRINELLPNPVGDDDLGEFIELYNGNNEDIDLEGFFFEDSSGDQYTFPKGDIIKSKALFAIARPTLTLTLVNSNQTISLFDPDGKPISSVTYEKTKEGVSLNYTATGRRGGTPTPGAANQLNNLPETKEKVPKKGYRGISVDFDARGKDSDRDALKYTWDFGDGHKSYKEKTAHAYEKNGTYTVTLKTTDGKDDTSETFAIEIRSYKAPEVRITSLMPNPTGNDTDNEWIMIENREKKAVNLKGFGIATGWKTLVSHRIREDFFIEPKKEAKLTRQFSLFVLPNQKGKVELRAPDGKVLQEIKYKLEKSIAENIIYQKKKGQRWKFEESVVKNILSSGTPGKTNEPDEITPTENITEEPLPSIPAEDIPEEAPKMIPAPLSPDPDRPLPQEILAYGTRIRLPDTVTLAPAANNEESAPLPERKSVSLSLPERIATDINASLNELLNGSQEK